MIAASASDWADYALALFLVLAGLGLGYALLTLAGVFQRAAQFIRSSEREVMPVIQKTGGTIDRVNRELDKIDPATDSAVDAVVAVDEAVRAVSFAVKRPIQRLVGISAGARHGWATLRAKRDLKAAVASGKEAAERREADFADDLRKAHG
jgi:dienelactone hydrolase